MQPQAEFYRSLPARRMTSVVLLFNEKDHVLVVQPTDKKSWELPGGGIELDESPKGVR
jgi:8-oxo-dGTP pyrophosphatase MutT (NUDIX family)